jgi:YhcH/YjgK/YiaL family protein
MIYDSIGNIARYGNKFELIRQFLLKNKFSPGKFDLDDHIHAIALEYETKNQIDLEWEAHRKFVDFHFIIEGKELVQLSDVQTMNEKSKYQDDFQLFEGNASQIVQCEKNDFLILYPNEVHKTSIKVHQTCTVRKYVFKIRI